MHTRDGNAFSRLPLDGSACLSPLVQKFVRDTLAEKRFQLFLGERGGKSKEQVNCLVFPAEKNHTAHLPLSRTVAGVVVGRLWGTAPMENRFPGVSVS